MVRVAGLYAGPKYPTPPSFDCGYLERLQPPVSRPRLSALDGSVWGYAVPCRNGHETDQWVRWHAIAIAVLSERAEQGREAWSIFHFSGRLLARQTRNRHICRNNRRGSRVCQESQKSKIPGALSLSSHTAGTHVGQRWSCCTGMHEESLLIQSKNLKLDVLRGDLGPLASPPKAFQDRFLSRAKLVQYLRTRQCSRSTLTPPFLVPNLVQVLVAS